MDIMSENTDKNSGFAIDIIELRGKRQLLNQWALFSQLHIFRILAVSLLENICVILLMF